MKIMIHGLHMELTPAITSYVEEKIGVLEHMLSAKDAALAEARVEVGKPSQHHQSGAVFYAEANLKIGRNLMRAEASGEDLYAAINLVHDELIRQIHKHKTKIISKHRRGKRTSS